MLKYAMIPLEFITQVSFTIENRFTIEVSFVSRVIFVTRNWMLTESFMILLLTRLCLPKHHTSIPHTYLPLCH